MHISQFFLEYVLSFIILIVVLVFVHELGHFLVARICGVKIESFSIGFGKELWGFTDKKGTRWKLAPLPLGGYVKMKGEMLPENKEVDGDRDSFHNKKLWQKALIVLAGPVSNLILPIVIFIIIPLFFGFPSLKPEIKNTLPNTPAAKVLQKGDIISNINNQKINSFAELNEEVRKYPGQNVNIKILRHGKPLSLKIKLGSKEENYKKIGWLGVEASQNNIFSEKYGLVKSIKTAFILYKNTLFNIIYGFKQLLTGKVKSDDIGGPIKIFELSGNMAKHGIVSWLFFLAALSINLAIVNLIPIPALDGGHLFLYLIESIIRRPIPYPLQKFLVMGGFFFLIGLIVLISMHDILGLFK